ncbi:MAG TPA: ATP-binding protein [Caulobacteraceae bacterium]|jgi:signal transduction histidine kinase/CheY-like chemotaxis protein|nr:ATP-binding protein [Caulobacteraceae bacterium]
MWLLVAACYLAVFLLRQWGLTHFDGAEAAIAIWRASPVLAAGLLLMPRGQRPWCVAACCLGSFCAGLVYGDPVRPLLGIGESWMIAALATWLCGPKPNFSESRKLFVFLAGAVVPSILVSTLASYLLFNAMGAPVGLKGSVERFLGHLIGLAILVPALTVILDQRRFQALRRSRLELYASLGGLTALAATLFFGHGPALWFLMLPVMMLLAFRHGPLGSAAGALIITVLSLARTYGVSEAVRAASLLQSMQFFIATVFMTTLPTAGAVASYARMRSLLDRRTRTSRLARRRADEAARAKGEFLANMSHEIRTPLNGVIGLSDALSRTELTPAQRDLLNMILGSGKALTGLLSDALDLARADSSALSLAAEPFDVRETVREAAFLFETIAHEKGLDFEVVFDLDPPGAAVGDALRIKQIVSNLISNAVKFTATGSVTVTVSLKRTPEGRGVLRAVVSDSGPGFDDEVKARLFNRFEQGDSSVTRRFGGAGLGLAISQRLAAMMDGVIDCYAEPGQGATFSFQAPVDFAVAAIEAARDHDGDRTVDGERLVAVLLAEDNPVNQKVVQAMLSDIVDLTIVGDGQAAVAAWRNQAFDVILMDTHMPVMDGLTAIRTIRAEEQRDGAARVPIVSLTADAMPQQVAAALAAGADLHVAKPITGAGLIGALRTCLQVSAADANDASDAA